MQEITNNDERACRIDSDWKDGKSVEHNSSSMRRSLRCIELTLYAMRQQNAEIIELLKEIRTNTGAT